MRLVKLMIENIRSHEQTELEFGKLNLVTGPNGVGKSTIKSSILFALTGRNEWGSRSKELVRKGASFGQSDLEIEGFGSIERTVKAEGGTVVKVAQKALPDKEVEKEIQDVFGVDYDALASVIDSGEFIGKSSEEQKDFLFSLAKAALTPDKVISFMDAPSQEAQEKVKKLLPLRVGMDALDSAYKTLFMERRQAKRELEQLKARLKATQAPAQNAPYDKQDLAKQELALQKEREQALQGHAVLIQGKKQIVRFENSMKELDAKIEQFRKNIGKLSVEELEEEIFGLVMELDGVKKDLESNSVVFKVLNSQLGPLKDIVAKLNTPICPLSDRLVCKTDKTVLTGELTERLKETEAKLAEAKAKMEEATARKQKLESQKEAYEKELKAHRDLAAALSQKAQLEEQKPQLPQGDEATLRGRVDELAKELEAVRKKQREVELWERDMKAYNELNVQLAKTQQDVDLLEYLVKEFSPKGVKLRILKKIVGPIEQHINSVLESLTEGKFKAKFDFSEDDFKIYVDHGKGDILVQNLSPSEQLRVCLAFQDAFSYATNLRILVVDNLEILDEENERMFYELLKEIASRYETIILIEKEAENKIGKLRDIDPDARLHVIYN